MTNNLEQICPGCGRGNGCAVAAGRSAAACWCMGSITRLPVPEDDSACYCEKCLQTIAKPIDSESESSNAR